MIKIQKGDTLTLKDGRQVTAVGSVFKMNSADKGYYAVPVDTGEFQLPVDVQAVVQVWRDGQPVLMQLELF